jgi:hypothetical protein
MGLFEYFIDGKRTNSLDMKESRPIRVQNEKRKCFERNRFHSFW